MNAIKNKVQLIGHLGQVPDIKTIGDGKKWLTLVWLPTRITKMPKVKK